jgi:phenylalanyl-tRNA synthetase beta chain
MKVTSGWIKSMLRRTMSDTQVIEALEQAGMEIEQIVASKEIDKRVVIALVKKVVQHPGADRLHLVDVGVGERQFRVVCGASNVREGLKVAFAQIGSVLPGGDKIEKVKLRGEVSEGMLCSERELALGNDHNGIMELPGDAVVGTPLRDLYPADTLIDLKTPANRFDVQSVVGLAREVAGMAKNELVLPSPPAVKISAEGPGVMADGRASRYMLAHMRVNPEAAHSPRHMMARLRAAGMRSLGPVVDVTNYVMLEYGQPLHAFDARKVKPPIAIRMARAGESLTTLDGVKRELTAEDLVIVDKSGPIALAGVMGGASTEVGPETTEILLEAAAFDAVLVRKAAKRHGLRTEASARFERDLPVELTPLALARAVELLGEVAGGVLVAATDQLNARPKRRSIELRMDGLKNLLGFGISSKEAKAALTGLGIDVGDSSKDLIVVPRVPWWRPDLRLPEDLVEEIVRVVGYERVPSTIPSWRPKHLKFDRTRSKRRLVQEVMYGGGMFEVMTYSFVSLEQLESLGLAAHNHLKLKNPLSLEQAYLRSSLLPSHLAVLSKNRTYAKEFGFYEISHVFVKRGAGEQPDEPERLAVTIRRPEAALAAAKGVLDALAWALNVPVVVEPGGEAVFAPGRAGVIWLEGRAVGRIGQLHPQQLRRAKVDGEAAYLELDLTPLVEAATPRQFAGLNRFPATVRDLAVIVPAAVTWREVRQALAGVAGMEPEFVSDYYGAGVPEGSKSLAIRLTIAHPDRTPTEEEAADIEAKAMSILSRKFAAARRD